jgi:hypothetical protein
MSPFVFLESVGRLVRLQSIRNTAFCGAKSSVSTLRIFAIACSRAIRASNWAIFHHNLLAPESIRAYLTPGSRRITAILTKKDGVTR